MPRTLDSRAAAASDTASDAGADGKPLIADVSDFLFYGALAMLPVDGTVAGPYMPFWTPISPWLFIAYAVANLRFLPQTWVRFRAFLAFPVLLVALSAIGWAGVAFHPLAALDSLVAVLGAVACLVSIDIAVRVKRLSWHRMIDLVVLVYWFAFSAGVAQWLAIRFDWATVRDFFVRLMSREYITFDSKWGGGRPQFLFAEPSYIGMHLFGVLLPLSWLTRCRDRMRTSRLRALVVVFAAGAVLMGAGVRIILDSIVALILVIVVTNDWRSRRGRLTALAEMAGTAALGVLAVVVNGRLSSIAEQGVGGDGSFYARLWQSLGPIAGALRHPLSLVFGYGAGNLSDATHDGADSAVRVLERLGLDGTAPRDWYAQTTPSNMFTMSAYTSFLVEFGIVASSVLVALVVLHVTGNHAWNRMTVCWLLLVAYLYVQFEGYAFYALPLFLWAVASAPVGRRP